jgi:exopolysaccharide biosynthesis polyprenyl glycosylphosphotransferase
MMDETTSAASGTALRRLRDDDATATGSHPPDVAPAHATADAIGRRDSLYRRLLALADMCAVTLALTFSAIVLGDDRLTIASLAVPPLFVLVVKAAGLYDRDEHLLHKTTLDEVPALFGIATLGTLLLYLADGLLIDGALGRRQIFGTWMLLFVLMMCFRALGRGVALRMAPIERCLLVGSPAMAEYVRDKLAVSRSVKAMLVGTIGSEFVTDADNGRRETNGNGYENLGREIGPILMEHGVDRVILSAGAEGRDDLLYTIRELKTYGVKVSVLPELSRVAGSSVELDHLHGMTMLGMRRFEFSRSSRFVKRSFDFVGAALGLAVLSPLLIAVAAAIKITSRGPVLFQQSRVGRNGRVFQMLKFRSMVNEAEQRKEELRELNQGATGLFKIPDDPRVTRIGRVLRRWQLDELPQLWNVLRGQMSLVGPRPLIPEEDEQIEGWYRRRLDVPPGITGHWQVLGSSAQVPLAEMVKLDYLYVANWSLWSDIVLLLRTVPFVVGRHGI